MNCYTSTIPLSIAEKLKEKGMHKLVDSRMEGWLNSGNNITYAEVFDWFSTKGINIGIVAHWTGIAWRGFDFMVSNINSHTGTCFHICWTWHKAANAAIEKALTLI